MRILRILPLLAVLGACSDSSGPSAPNVEVQTIVNSSPGQGQPNVAITVENQGSRPVLLEHCGDRLLVMVDRREDGEWETYKGGLCTAEVSWAPRELAPGARLTAAEWLTQPGRYRLRLAASYRDDREPVRTVTSGGFTVR